MKAAEWATHAHAIWPLNSRCRARIEPGSLQQLRQLGDVGGDAPRLVAGEQLGRRPSSRLILEMDVSERLPVGVAYDEALRKLLDRPRRREAPARHGEPLTGLEPPKPFALLCWRGIR
jgi:hypothetical protein